MIYLSFIKQIHIHTTYPSNYNIAILSLQLKKRILIHQKTTLLKMAKIPVNSCANLLLTEDIRTITATAIFFYEDNTLSKDTI